MGSPGSVLEPVEHSQRRASRAGINGLGSANYQTKPNPVRYSETKPKPLTLELLWILRALLYAADPFYRFYAGCALCEHCLRLAESYGKVAEEQCIRERLSQLRKHFSHESTVFSKPCGRAQSGASGAGKAIFSLPSAQQNPFTSEFPSCQKVLFVSKAP